MSRHLLGLPFRTSQEVEAGNSFPARTRTAGKLNEILPSEVWGKGGGSGRGNPPPFSLSFGSRTRNFLPVLPASCPQPNEKLPASEVEIIERPSTARKTLGHQRNAMHIVRELRARIEVKKEVMEEEENEHARRHAQLKSVVEAKMKEAEGALV